MTALAPVATRTDSHGDKTAFARRDAALDPLLLAAAAAGPSMSRNHYHHDFYPGGSLPLSEDTWDRDHASKDSRLHSAYTSRQAPRSQRLAEALARLQREQELAGELEESLRITEEPAQPKLVPEASSSALLDAIKSNNASVSAVSAEAKDQSLPPLVVKCMARTRIPTPHGPAFLHLYHNNRDSKEHLAMVIDSAQLTDHPGSQIAPPIRSQTLDAIWEGETEKDRITRGAYVGRLSATSQHPSGPSTPRWSSDSLNIPAPLIRIHSECFTGETVGSMRCDCGEQLDEAIRLISQPITLPAATIHSKPVTIPGRGAVVYLRQEGRGIGLLSKIRAYNIQDLGYDTVEANLMLGHKADERAYDIAAAILRDLGLGDDSPSNEGVRVLTNNPDKVQALGQEGINVVERVQMIPRSWRSKTHQGSPSVSGGSTPYHCPTQDEPMPSAGATLIGGSAVHGEDLDKYLKTKVTRMGHMLPPLWAEKEEAK